jgi:thiamine biosynthesis protein ThiS
MEIKYQGKATETDATTIAAFLAEWGVKPTEAVVEVDGEIVAADAMAATPLREGAELNVFRIVAGG